MLHTHNIPTYFWAKAINTTCYIANKVFLKLETNKTSYELWSGKKPNLKPLVMNVILLKMEKSR